MDTEEVLDSNILTLYQTTILEDENIMDYEENPSFSIYPNMPLFKYGFYWDLETKPLRNF